ncbi:MAG: polysaccharide deacetylase family protein [Candidatus Nanosyncoccaceae bacterium]
MQKKLKNLLKNDNTPYLFIILSGVIFLILAYIFQDNGIGLVNKRTYQKNSAYNGISSNFVTEQKWQVKSQREYPITSNDSVNQKLAQKIDKIHRDYLGQLKNKTDKLSYKEHTSFSVTYNRNQLLSISVNSVQDSDSKAITVLTKPETFDLNTGESIKLSDIFINPDHLNTRVLPDLRRSVAKEIQQTKPDFNVNKLEQKLTTELADNFLVHQDGNFQFEFTPEQLDADYSGKLIVNLPATNYLPIMKPDLANRLFDQSTIDLNSPESPQNRSGFCNEHPCIALTFDDGPSAQTNRILDILQKYNIKATFFILGKNAQAHQDIIKRQIEEGHQVGHHGWNHTAFNRLNSDQLHDELNRTNEILQAYNSYTPRVARPPYGILNQSSLDVLRDRGQDIILWSVDPWDWDVKDASQIYNRVITASHNGAIILLHDIYPSTADAVEPIINYLQDNGYYLVTINTLLGDVPPSGSVYRKR